MTSFWREAARQLADAGVTAVFGLPSDEPGLLDAASDHPLLTSVCLRDQRAAACAAAGFGVATGRPAVVALNSGPSFTNAITGLLEASSLGVPIVVVTTRIAVDGIGRGGFQDMDQQALIAPLAGWFHRVERSEDLRWAIERAVHLSLVGRPGLAVLEVTAEAQAGAPDTANSPAMTKDVLTVPTGRPSPDALAEAMRLLRAAERPLVLAGGGARHAGTHVVRLARALGAPILTTAAGRGVVDESDELSLGLAGLYLTPPLHQVTADADLVLILGSALEETVRMGWPELSYVHVIHVDRSAAAFGRSVRPDLALLGDVADTCSALCDLLGTEGDTAASTARLRWLKHVRTLREESFRAGDSSHVAAVLRELVRSCGEDVTLVQENGLHDMWSYHPTALRVGSRTIVVAPGEQTMMGFGMGAAVGAGVAHPDRTLLIVCGDGAAELGMTVLPTLAEHARRAILVVLDNRGWGWPRRGRSEDGNRALTTFDTSLPVEAIVEGLGGWTGRLDPGGDPRAVFAAAHAAVASGGLALVRVVVTDDDVPPGVLRIEAIDA